MAAQQRRGFKTFRLTDAQVKPLLAGSYCELVKDGSGNLAFTGAKIYYRGRGWWRFSGYSWDYSDIDPLVLALV